MTDIVAQFDATEGAWIMQFEDGWWANFEDEPPLGPFETKREAEAAARADGLKLKGAEPKPKPTNQEPGRYEAPYHFA